ncbi:MAG: heme exporter protein CcmB [Desulfonatronovibrionaceae bacterium]
MLRPLFFLVRKDLRLVLSGGGGPVQAVLLGLLLVFMFSLGSPVGSSVSAPAAATVFWLASAFSLILIYNNLYLVEEENRSRVGLVLGADPVQVVYLGKAVAGFLLLLLTQVFFFPAIVVFLGQELSGDPVLMAAVLAVDAGMVFIGGLLGASAQGTGVRDSLLSIIIFPLLMPVILAGIRLLAQGMSPEPTVAVWDWLLVVAAFDAIFAGTALILFPFMYTGE